ncbi:TRAP transporter small permease subunit [Pseudovibrio sp. POLY-S9]|uniref:TRAP transporter small permease subunit n=1 Tax=Pseudovibrio sp. POLY-S9 TaxID=1576596 RepID=UPI00070BEC73|nr:TRAP transporter small permease subunit [Pseudovibrio sp. POLY-S9]
MPRGIVVFVRYVDWINKYVCRFAMYLIFVMLGVLLYSSIAKTFFAPPLWTLETAQFTMAAYYLLGGAYSMQTQSHVRMDLFYGSWSPRRKATMDVMTILLLILYLIFLLYGGLSSLEYAVKYGEESYSAWAPPMAPIKAIMCFGIFLMLLQAIATFFKDLAAALGRPAP